MKASKNMKDLTCEPKAEIKAVTWSKDSHGLFDYESKSLSHKKFVLDSTTRLYRTTINEVDIRSLEDLKKDRSIETTSTQLVQIIKRENVNVDSRYVVKIENPDGMEIEEDVGESVYLIVRSLKNKDNEQKGYPLEIDDIIKLGRIEYMVSEIKVKDTVLTSKKSDIDSAIEAVYEVVDDLKGSCKICLIEEDDEENFFVSPCSCKGSCLIVHINCLKKWIQSKMVVKHHAVAVSYNFTKFECEICKDPYPRMIKKKEKGYELFVIERPQTPYIMLESLQLRSQGRNNKTLYLIGPSPTAQKIKLGRGHQCQIRITDISVSRQHAYIKYQNDKFLILDNNSKFGTLIKLQKDLPIRVEKVAVQVGRTVITCALKYEEAVGKDKSMKTLQPMETAEKWNLKNNGSPNSFPKK